MKRSSQNYEKRQSTKLMEPFKYKLRLLSSEVVLEHSSPRAGASAKIKEFSPVEITVEADSVEIRNGVAYFISSKRVKTAMSLRSFVWAPMGETPPNVTFEGFPEEIFAGLSPHDFSYQVRIDRPMKVEPFFDQSGNKMGETVTHLEIACHTNCIVLSNGIFYFVNRKREYVYSAPSERTYFYPLGQTIMNLIVYNTQGNGKVEIIRSYADIQPGSGSSGTSGVDGRDADLVIGGAGSDGEKGIDGKPGADGTSGTSGIDGTPGADGSDGQDGTSGTSGTDGISGANGQDGSSGLDGVDGVDGTSGTSGADGIPGANGQDGSSGTSGVSGVGFNWQGSWDSTILYKKNDAVRQDNKIWVSLTDNQGQQPSLDPLHWDLMVSDIGDSHIASIKVSLNSSEIATLKTNPLRIYQAPPDRGLEVISASLVFSPGNSPYAQTTLILTQGETSIGGFEKVLTSTSPRVHKGVILEGYDTPLGSDLVLRSNTDPGKGDGTASLSITYRLL
jgi:hypothetical protein